MLSRIRDQHRRAQDRLGAATLPSTYIAQPHETFESAGQYVPDCDQPHGTDSFPNLNALPRDPHLFSSLFSDTVVVHRAAVLLWNCPHSTTLKYTSLKHSVVTGGWLFERKL